MELQVTNSSYSGYTLVHGHTCNTMDDHQWSQVRNILYNWVHRHPNPLMDESLALWLGVNDDYKVYQ